MDTLKHIIDIFLHLDRYLDGWVATMGTSLYGVLFLVVFCETGLVVTPFLPGDSLLFAVGAVCARDDSPLSLPIMIVLLFIAAVAGDAVNYSIGRKLGPAAFRSESSRLLNKKHLLRTQAFYEKHGGKTIIIARFMPIIRTFAPFVAGIGEMKYRRFFVYNVVGAAAWVVSFSVLGWRFGSEPSVKKNFTYVIAGIILLSVLPGVIAYLREWRRSKAGVAEQAAKS